MPQATLFAPDVTCDHCIATIQKAVDSVDGARFLAGDPDSKSFAVDLAPGVLLDRLAEVLAAEGYPLGEAAPARAVAASSGTSSMTMGLPMASVASMPGGAHTPAPAAEGFQPTFTVEKSERGALVTYNCPCGSTTEQYEYDRSQPEQAVGSCCGHHLLIQPDAGDRLRAQVGDAYQVTVQTVEMPWGQPIEAAFATRG